MRQLLIYRSSGSVNGGIAVAVENPGCLNESGRNSIYMQDGSDVNDYVLVISPSPDCPCQNGCIETDNLFLVSTCVGLANTSNGPSGSFRFVGASNCPANNC